MHLPMFAQSELRPQPRANARRGIASIAAAPLCAIALAGCGVAVVLLRRPALARDARSGCLDWETLAAAAA